MRIALFVLCLSFSALSAGEAKPDVKHEGIALADLPAPVKAAVTKAVGDGKLAEIEKETIAGKVVYEIEFHDAKGEEHEAYFDETGAAVEHSHDVDEKDEKKKD